jgi:hypothetical protein
MPTRYQQIVSLTYESPLNTPKLFHSGSGDVQCLRGREARHPNEQSLVATSDRAYSEHVAGEYLFKARQRRERVDTFWYCGGT